MTQPFDLIAIGTGAAASTAASKCRKAGWRVAIVDARPFGGTCALRGCDPKKVLVGAADLLDSFRRLQGAGISGTARIDWADLMAFKRTFTRDVPTDREASFHAAGIATFHGTARFTGPNTLRVGDQELEGRHVLVATGAKPRPLDIPGAEYLRTSTDFLDLDVLPERIVFVGGGYISFEFAHVAVRAGAEVTILHRSDRPLGGFEPDLVDRLVEATRDLGVKVHLRSPVKAVEMDEDGTFVVHTPTSTVATDFVVHGAGRIPDLEGLGLEAAGVAHDKRGVQVDEHLQSVSNPHVYAAGDAAATPGWPLTPVASMEGHVAAGNMLGDKKRVPDYRGTASIVFTVPPLARVGATVAEAEAAGRDVEVRHGDMDDWYSYRRLAHAPARYKVLVDRETGQIVGAHLLGTHAEEVVNLFALAIRAGATARDLKQVPWGYPTHGSDLPYML